MDFDLSEEQVAFRGTARDYLAQRWPLDAMRTALDNPPAVFPADLWSEIAGLGWLGVGVPEEWGGSGADLVTVAVLCEEAGRGLLPGPFLSAVSAVTAWARLLERSAVEPLLADLATGEQRATPAFEEVAGGLGGPLATTASSTGHGWVLSGTKILVPDGEGADVLLVTAAAADGPALFAVPARSAGVVKAPLRRLDAQALSEVILEEVWLPVEARVGGDGDGAAAVSRGLDVCSVLLAADLLGTASRVLEMTTQYATERIQFDRPIGTFQAVSHRLADVAVDVEIGRSLIYGACLALDEGHAEGPALASASKAWMGDAAVRAAESAVQIHGGIGYTWELDVHLFLRRARANAVTLGDPDDHRDRVASLLEAGSSVGPA